jgi:hypothetical protein
MPTLIACLQRRQGCPRIYRELPFQNRGIYQLDFFEENVNSRVSACDDFERAVG